MYNLSEILEFLFDPDTFHGRWLLGIIIFTAVIIAAIGLVEFCVFVVGWLGAWIMLPIGIVVISGIFAALTD
jgi:hypothetical protein